MIREGLRWVLEHQSTIHRQLDMLTDEIARQVEDTGSGKAFAMHPVDRRLRARNIVGIKCNALHCGGRSVPTI
jgi:hypothetical protein